MVNLRKLCSFVGMLDLRAAIVNWRRVLAEYPIIGHNRAGLIDVLRRNTLEIAIRVRSL